MADSESYLLCNKMLAYWLMAYPTYMPVNIV